MPLPDLVRAASRTRGGNRRPDFVERIRLHQLVTGSDDAAEGFGEVLGGNVRPVVDAATRIDAAERRVSLAGGGTVAYDYLIYAVGSGAADPGVPGAAEFAHSVSDLEGAQRLRSALAATPATAPVTRDAVRLGDGRELPSAVTIWTAGFRVPDLAACSGLRTDTEGRLLTDATLTSVDDVRIVAAGDAAAMTDWRVRKEGPATAYGRRPTGARRPLTSAAWRPLRPPRRAPPPLRSPAR
ncbi:FAD-dependent oxidoreductase [Nonomuraea sp. 10N515B]|uniref:FAD-dependent oxidoreductase n=1 Tax=Nonomuraea sp. 10N515B TaxID=3457422 RepID=UPI003FCC8E4E